MRVRKIITITFRLGLRFCGGICSVTLKRVFLLISSAKKLASCTSALALNMSALSRPRERLNVSSRSAAQRSTRAAVVGVHAVIFPEAYIEFVQHIPRLLSRSSS